MKGKAWGKQFSNKVAKINRNLASLEASDMAGESPSYRTQFGIATTKPKGKGAIYNIINTDNGPVLRLKSKKEFDQLSPELQHYYMERVNEIVETHKTLTKTGLKKWQREKFVNFKEKIVRLTSVPVYTKSGEIAKTRSGKPRYYSPYSKMTEQDMSELMDTFRKLNDKMDENYTSSQMNKATQEIDIFGVLENQGQEGLEKILQYYFTNRFDLIAKEFFIG